MKNRFSSLILENFQSNRYGKDGEESANRNRDDDASQEGGWVWGFG
jgi:hypothetical protein